MTELKGGSEVSRKTQLEYKGRKLCVTLFPKFIRLRESGRAKESGVNVSYDAIFELGLKKQAMRREETNEKG